MQAILSIDASQPQHIPAGRIVGMMYYRHFLDSTLQRHEYSGYPHNGGSHTLYLRLNAEDLRAFLDLVQERYASVDGAKDFVESVKTRVAQKYPRIALQ